MPEGQREVSKPPAGKPEVSVEQRQSLFDVEKFSELSEADKIKVWQEKNPFPWERTPVDVRRHFLNTGEFAGPGAMNAPGGEQEPNYPDLLGRIREYGSRRAEHIQLRPNDVQEEIALRAEEANLASEVNEIIDRSPVVESSQFPPELLQIASFFRETRERLINRILFRAFEDPTETREYGSSMNLYAQSHLETLLGNLERVDPERYLYFQGLETAALFFHGMNARLIAGNLNEFMRIAENLSYQHFGFMQRIRGVNEAMRKFEEKYLDFIARNRRITPEGYDQLKREVREELKRSNEVGLLTSEFEADRVGETAGRMEPWEIERAVNVARAFFNITFRAGELISTGQIPQPLKEYIHLKRSYSSFPQESAVKIMNWIQWTTDRFQIASTRGGVEFLDRVKKNYFEFLAAKKRKLGINRIVKFGGMKTDEMEVGGMFAVSGVYSSWRLEDMASSSIKLTIDGETMSIEEWLERNEDTVAEAKKSNDPDRYLAVVSPIIENVNMGLGWLIKHGLFGGEVGYKVRRRLWERVAENNLPLMINYLSKLQFGEIRDGQLVAAGQEDDSPLSFRNLTTGWTEENLNAFRRKIALNHERRMNEAAGQDVTNVRIEFTPDELALIDRIKNAGRQIAPQLADVAFPYVPFMNDIPFALLDYTVPGNEFYKRRNGDLVSYNKAEIAFLEIMNNPTGMELKDAIGHYDAIVKGIESPQGTPDAQERVFPMYEAWIDTIMTRPGERQALLKAIKESLRKPTSEAQKWGEMEALSVTETQAAKIINESVKVGIIDVKLAKEMRKKKNLGLLGILWALFRDLWYVPFIAGAISFGKETAKG